ncbi:hypothetical protein HYT00_03580 [Candidatus Giovannonibacteria bacterium]|nr:hypothetical protein [Candidatus Giovannonibacteria bacterium]
MKQKFFEIVCLLLVMIVNGAEYASAGEGPKKLLQKKITVLQGLLGDPIPSNHADFSEWRGRILRESYDFFDFREMGRLSLGKHVGVMNGRESEYYSAFVGNLLNLFIETIRINRQFQMLNFKEIVDMPNGKAGVAAEIVIAETSNLRSQFVGTIRKHSFEYLLNDLRSKGLEKTNR